MQADEELLVGIENKQTNKKHERLLKSPAASFSFLTARQARLLDAIHCMK